MLQLYEFRKTTSFLTIFNPYINIINIVINNINNKLDYIMNVEYVLKKHQKLLVLKKIMENPFFFNIVKKINYLFINGYL